jgi:hypothetical protein
MHKILNSFFFLFLLTSQSQACMEPNYPDLDDLNKYESIYLAEVTSVYLESNENSLLFVSAVPLT